MSREETLRSISNVRKRRGVIRSSLTKLITKTNEIETSGSPLKRDRAQQALIKLDSLDKEFRAQHFQLIDYLEEEDELSEQQEVLDQTDDDIATMRFRLSQLITWTTPTDPDERGRKITDEDERGRRIINRKLAHVERTLQSIHDSVSALDPEAPDKHLVKQYEEQLNDIKSNLNTTHSDLLSLEIEDTDELYTNHMGLERLLFECSLQVRRLSAGAGEHEGVKLPKIEVPTFDGNILSWRRFWEQFSVSVHERSSLSGSEKLVYLQHALKNGSANVVIDSLSQSKNGSTRALKC